VELSFGPTVSPAVPTSGTGWLTGRIARFILSRIRVGRLTIMLPSGQRLCSTADTPGPKAVLILHRWRAVWRTVLNGDVDFGAAYVDGDWDSPDISALIELAALNPATLNSATQGHFLARLWRRLSHRMNANSKRGSKRNIRFHYDLGNDFYAAWLDPGMTYSSALYQSADQTLEDAQTAKQDHVIALLDLKGGERVLEIGCGWGGLAERLITRAACHVTGVTLSPAQHAWSAARLARFGGQAEMRLQDYRDVGGTFDRIASVEMVEAVGEAWWPTYFITLRDRLTAGGVAVLQAITIAEERFERYRHRPDFVQRYIFPGGMLPTDRVIRRETARAGLVLNSVETFGDSYARTLVEWRRRFVSAWPAIERQGFDTRFKRMWEYYLDYCAAGFRAGVIDVGFYVLSKPEAS